MRYYLHRTGFVNDYREIPKMTYLARIQELTNAGKPVVTVYIGRLKGYVLY